MSLIEDWKEDNPDILTPKEALEEEYTVVELEKEIQEWGRERKIDFLRSIVSYGDKQLRDDSEKTKLNKAIARTVKLARANQLYKERIEKFQEKLQEESEA